MSLGGAEGNAVSFLLVKLDPKVFLGLATSSLLLGKEANSKCFLVDRAGFVRHWGKAACSSMFSETVIVSSDILGVMLVVLFVLTDSIEM